MPGVPNAGLFVLPELIIPSGQSHIQNHVFYVVLLPWFISPNLQRAFNYRVKAYGNPESTHFAPEFEANIHDQTMLHVLADVRTHIPGLLARLQFP